MRATGADRTDIVALCRAAQRDLGRVAALVDAADAEALGEALPRLTREAQALRGKADEVATALGACLRPDGTPLPPNVEVRLTGDHR